MGDTLLDEVKSNRADKQAKISLIFSILLFLCFSFKVVLELDAEKGIGFILDCLLLLFIAISSFNFFRKLRSKKGQYIQWWTNKVSYKLSNDNSPQEINLSDVTSISVGIDEIVIITSDNQKHELNIVAFTDYNIRLRIKDNFKTLVQKHS